MTSNKFARCVRFWLESNKSVKRHDQEPNMTTSKLSLLIDSLASGADVYASRTDKSRGVDTNEMQVILDGGMHQVRES
jgi:ribosome assembly protein 3